MKSNQEVTDEYEASGFYFSLLDRQGLHRGSNEERGRAFFFAALNRVKSKKPPSDVKIPTQERNERGTPKASDVITIANNLLIQFKAA
mmetsp:Transcript_19581/g.29651  ORF Transcript_19581/g.29651 Transcript_19581/m.29651 type:complete len:88 (-) Transcript_19581:1466-1729(-)